MNLVLGQIRCRHCNAAFAPPSLPVSAAMQGTPAPGGKMTLNPSAAQQALQAALQSLWLHLQQHHQPIAIHAMLQGEQLKGVLVLHNFKLNDELTQEGDRIRHAVHRATRAVNVPDDKIAAQVASLGLEAATAARVEAMMRQMRDVLTEENRLAQAGEQKR